MIRIAVADDSRFRNDCVKDVLPKAYRLLQVRLLSNTIDVATE